MVRIAGAFVLFGNRADSTVSKVQTNPVQKELKLIVATMPWSYARFSECGLWPGHMHRFVPQSQIWVFFNQCRSYLDAGKCSMSSTGDVQLF